MDLKDMWEDIKSTMRSLKEDLIIHFRCYLPLYLDFVSLGCIICVVSGWLYDYHLFEKRGKMVRQIVNEESIEPLSTNVAKFDEKIVKLLDNDRVMIFTITKDSKGNDSYSSEEYTIPKYVYNEIHSLFVNAIEKNITNEDELFEKLINFTEKQPVETKVFGSCEKFDSKIKNALNEDNKEFIVSGIEDIETDNENNLAKFKINLLQEAEDGKIAAKQLVVVQDLTDEIKNNPENAYSNYINDVSPCYVTSQNPNEQKWFMRAANGEIAEASYTPAAEEPEMTFC